MKDHRTLGLIDALVMCTFAGLCAYSLVNLLPGGHTNITRNSAARGGAAALVDASLIVQPGHTLTAQRNAAHRHGGAFALLSGAGIMLLETAACPATRWGGGPTTAPARRRRS